MKFSAILPFTSISKSDCERNLSKLGTLITPLYESATVKDMVFRLFSLGVLYKKLKLGSDFVKYWFS